MRSAVAVFYNASSSGAGEKVVACFDPGASANNETRRDGELWDILYCNGVFQPFGQDGRTDMFSSRASLLDSSFYSSLHGFSSESSNTQKRIEC